MSSVYADQMAGQVTETVTPRCREPYPSNTPPSTQCGGRPMPLAKPCRTCKDADPARSQHLEGIGHHTDKLKQEFAGVRIQRVCKDVVHLCNRRRNAGLGPVKKRHDGL